ncbi:armadillo-type protein [Mycena sp. CBHHK59/15]|nr:armadillo-type protein [Mycena sp. CBHHK59/15]
MDVPFVSSGALNRAHYTLVRNVESAPSPEIADSYILKEVESIRSQLRHPTISLKETKGCLIVLLYCSMSITSPALPSGSLNFALPYAVQLAEAGKTVQEKRIGYLFCAEVMSPDHELRLMLVNTLRKDLEAPTTSLVCLSLDNLIMSPSEDVIPAVQSRLQDLLSNHSPHVRRRALLACSALSRFEPDLLRRITSKVFKRLKDPHPMVVSAALSVSLDLVKVHERARKDVKDVVNNLLRLAYNNDDKSTRWILLKIMHTLRTIGLFESNLDLVLNVNRSTSRSSDHPLMCAAFFLLNDVDASQLRLVKTSEPPTPAVNIRQLLASRNPNDQYIFLTCLNCLHPEIWAGTNADIPAVLEKWEVRQVMELLDSSDSMIRKKTLRTLNRIDFNIVDSYLSQSLQSLPTDLSLKGISEYTARLLEVIEIQADGDGETYARQLGNLFAQMEARSPRYAELVLENAVETVLHHLRNATTPFQIGCATTLVTSLASSDAFFGQTLMVIVPALATEYSGKLSVAPPDVLRGLASRLSSCCLAVQDACLLAMLRISADCEEVPSEVEISVNDLSERSGRHIQWRCEQFSTLSSQKDSLADIVQSAESSSLPDFLEALQTYKTRPSKTRSTSVRAEEPSSPSSSRASFSASKLRYTAYEAPPPTVRLRDRVSSGGSSPGRSGSRASSQLSGSSGRQPPDELSRTVTAGDLTLAAAILKLDVAAPVPETSPVVQAPADLIAFNDSPFITDPSADEPDFESIWNAFDESSGARGWCDVSTEEVIKCLEGMDDTLKMIPVDQLPFLGKFTIRTAGGPGHDGTQGAGVLRLRASEEGGCLWRMRCGDAQLRIRVKRLLTAIG